MGQAWRKLLTQLVYLVPYQEGVRIGVFCGTFVQLHVANAYPDFLGTTTAGAIQGLLLCLIIPSSSIV